jgi:hypothetical protein
LEWHFPVYFPQQPHIFYSGLKYFRKLRNTKPKTSIVQQYSSSEYQPSENANAGGSEINHAFEPKVSYQPLKERSFFWASYSVCPCHFVDRLVHLMQDKGDGPLAHPYNNAAAEDS